MRTGNNAKFVGYLADTPQAKEIAIRRGRWTREWLANPKIRTVFLEALKEAGGEQRQPTENWAACETSVTILRTQFSSRVLGFNRSDLYRIVPSEQVAGKDDFIFAWTQRRNELLLHWKEEPELKDFWEDKALFDKANKRSYQAVDDLSDKQFCELCQELLAWEERENEKRRRAHPRVPGLSRAVLGLRSSEVYEEPEDAPRIAAIYNGLSGRGLWVPFRKGDPQGNRWVDNEPLYIDWSRSSVDWLSTASEARWQGHSYFLTSGVTWTAVANHVAMKARFQEPCIFDADSMRLTPFSDVLDPLAFLALLNSDVVSFFKMKFVRHTQKWEIGDLRALPVVIPNADQADRLIDLAQHAIAAKRVSF